jgi:hypothetical protein
MAEWTVKGVSQVSGMLERVRKAVLDESREAMRQAGTFIVGQLPDESSIPERGSYHRTGTMMRAIHSDVKAIGSDIVGIIGVRNIALYAPWVISSEISNISGAGPQAWMHKGRWFTLQDEINKHLGDVMKFLQEGIRRALSLGR